MDRWDEAAFVAYAEAAIPRLRRIGFLVCGDWQRSEDAVQHALLKLYQSWTRISDTSAIDSFVRRCLVRRLVDDSRRPWRRERLRDIMPETEVDRTDVEMTWAVRDAMREVPARQRAVLTLRFYEQCDVAETAALLGCSEGTVKSQTARGLAKLRLALGDLAGDASVTTRGA